MYNRLSPQRRMRSIHMSGVLCYPEAKGLTRIGLQGYGLTETCAASFVALPRQDNSGTVGPPTAGAPLPPPVCWILPADLA